MFDCYHFFFINFFRKIPTIMLYSYKSSYFIENYNKSVGFKHILVLKSKSVIQLVKTFNLVLE